MGPNDVDAVIGVAVGQVLLPGAPVIWSVDGVVIPNVSGLSARVPAWKRKQSQAVVTAKGTSFYNSLLYKTSSTRDSECIFT